MWSWLGQHRVAGVVVLGAVLLVAGVATAWLVVFRSGSSPVSLRDAVRLYRLERAAASASTRPDPPGPLPAGVFSYRTSGQESLDLPGTERSFPDQTEMVTVGDAGVCSSVDWVALAEHTEKTTVCPGPGHSLTVTGFTTHEEIGGASTTTVITCPRTTYLIPPGAPVGARWSASCDQTGPTMTVALRGLVLPPHSFEIDGRKIPTTHVRFSLYFGSSGSSTTDLWLSVSRDVLVREYEVASVSAMGVAYSESMSTMLLSTTPAT